jgi:branched-chain amino acid transport system ATP-binding protein
MTSQEITSDTESAPLALRCEDYTRYFGTLAAVQNVGFTARAAATTAIIGPNGAGKTTLLNLLSGMLKPSSGRLWLKDEDVTKLGPGARYQRGLARTFQITRPIGALRAGDLVTLGAGRLEKRLPAAKDKAHAVMEDMRIADLWDVELSAVPAAQVRLVEFARCVASDPEVMFLDELMAGLTPSEVDVVIELVRTEVSRGRAVVIVEHVMQAVKALADDVVVLVSGGVLRTGKYEEIVRDPKVIEVYLGRSKHARSANVEDVDLSASEESV